MKDMGNVSDGYHTFNELYEHRHLLFAIICNDYQYKSWKSMVHADGTCYEGWFIAGITNPKGQQITYHIPLRLWDCFRCKMLDKAPKWDGHTSQDVLERLKVFKDKENY